MTAADLRLYGAYLPRIVIVLPFFFAYAVFEGGLHLILRTRLWEGALRGAGVGILASAQILACVARDPEYLDELMGGEFLLLLGAGVFLYGVVRPGFRRRTASTRRSALLAASVALLAGAGTYVGYPVPFLTG